MRFVKKFLIGIHYGAIIRKKWKKMNFENCYFNSTMVRLLAIVDVGGVNHKVISIPLLSRIYGLQSSTINEWIKKYDRKDLMNTRIMIENEDDISRLKALQKEIEQLKKLLLKKDLDQLVSESYLEVAAEMLGYKNVAELKKKLNIKP
jgi:hypothetical protein